MQAATSPDERIEQALTDWRTREGTLLLVVYGVMIAALCPAFYLVARVLPGHPADSLPLRLVASAVSLLCVLAVGLFQSLRPKAHRLQVLNVTVFLCVLVAALVNSGNSLSYLTLTIVGLFAVQYAFLRWQDIAISYIIAVDFEIVYSSFRVGFTHHSNIFAIGAVVFTSAICVASGMLRIRAKQADVESRTRLEIQTEEVHRQAQRIRHLAYSDSLTGLANRVGMNDRVDRALAFASRHDLMAALLYLDLDGFKEINDMHGHDIGDVVLLGAALRIQYVLRHGESIGRIGDVLHEPFSVGDEQFVLSASIGTALFPRDGGTRLELLAHADSAMYSVKRERRRQPVEAAEKIRSL